MIFWRPRGVAATELAIVLAMVLVFAIATVDMARFAVLRLAVCQAANVAANHGALRPCNDYTQADYESDVLQLAQAEAARCDAIDIAALEVVVEVTHDSNDIQLVRVTCEYPFTPCWPWAGFETSIPLRATASLRRFR